jgi:AcrR family transcriptional regulator
MVSHCAQRMARAIPRPKTKAPSGPRPRTKPAEVRREELLDAAEGLFLSQGVAATSVDEIVLAADVAKGTFYLHFASKEKLLAALQQRFVSSFCSDIAAAMKRRRADDWPGRLHAWIAAGVDGYLDRTALHDIVFLEFRPEDPRAEHENPIATLLATLLEQGTQAQAWSAEKPEFTAILLFSALHGALDDALSVAGGKGANVNRKRLTRALEAFFLRALGCS